MSIMNVLPAKHFSQKGLQAIILLLFVCTSTAFSAELSDDISLAQAQKGIQAALKKSQELDTKMNIAVVDSGANLVAFNREDNAWLGSIDISMKKAKTARMFSMDTENIGKLSQPGGPLYNIEISNGGLITFPGGVAIKNAAGQVVGAIGVSGSTVENDRTVALAGTEAITKALGGVCK